MQNVFLRVLCLLLLPALGCREEVSSPAPQQPRAKVKLTVLVVEDSSLAAGLSLLRGEWLERTGGQLVVEEGSIVDLLSAEKLAADLVIYPSRYVGTLVARDELRPVRNSVLQSEAFAQNDLLPLVRNRVLPYGGRVYGLSLGESPLVLAWQDNNPSDMELPTTWPQIDQAQLNLQASGQFTHPQIMEFLARAVGYSSHSSRTALWFEPKTLAPRITAPPFVRALKELNPMSSNQVAATIVWPQAARDSASGRWSPLPATAEIYNYSREIWEANEARAAPVVLGFSGRTISVTNASRNAASAFKLLNWLASGEIATKLSQRSKATVWFRDSQTSQASEWLSGHETAKTAIRVITRQLSAEDCFLLPRIPAIDEYLNVLATAVAQSQSGELTPQQALAAAAEQWEAITTKQGRERQALAYRKHLGYEEFTD